MNKIALLAIPVSLIALITAALLIPQDSRMSAVLGAGIGLGVLTLTVALLFRRGLIVPILFFVVLTLTACGSDPFGIVAREEVRSAAQVQTAQIQADAATDQARISASTARVRIGGWMVGAMIAAVAAVAVAGIVAMTHLQAQRDRLSADQWRNQLPMQQTATALPRARPAGHWLAISRPPRQQEPPHTLALPARSASHSDIVGIER